MARGTTQPAGPLRKELPCDFVVPKNARSRALTLAFVVGAIGVGLLWAGAAGLDGNLLTGLGIGALGLVMLGGAALVASAAYTSVRMDDEGLLVRKPGKAIRIAWAEIRSITFVATLKGPEHGPGPGGGIAGSAGRALANYMADDVKAGDPFLVGRVRQQYEPSATVSVVQRRGGVNLSSELGWGLFTALYAEADARGIEIVRA